MKTQSATRHDYGAFGRLNREWAGLCAQSGAAELFDRWMTAEPALQAAGSLSGLEPAARRDSDAVFGALLRLHHTGEAEAGRAVLHLMMPKIVRLARSQYSKMDEQDADAAAITCMWQAIHWLTGPTPKPHCARRLAMHCLHHLTRSAWVQPQEETPAHFGPPAEVPEQLLIYVGEQRALDDEVYHVLSDAMENGVISRSDARLLSQIYGCGKPNRAAIASQFGITEAALRQRCSRAVRALARSADLLTPAAA